MQRVGTVAGGGAETEAGGEASIGAAPSTGAAPSGSLGATLRVGERRLRARVSAESRSGLLLLQARIPPSSRRLSSLHRSLFSFCLSRLGFTVIVLSKCVRMTASGTGRALCPVADVDECSEKSGCCDHSCYNNPGSYRCDCFPGFRLAPDRCQCIGLSLSPPYCFLRSLSSKSRLVPSPR